MSFSFGSFIRVFVFCCSVVTSPFLSGRVVAQENAPQPIFDANNNGLYDDAERKILLDEFLRVSPELSGIIEENSAPVYKAKSKNPLIFDENAEKSSEVVAGEHSAVMNFDADGDGRVTILEMNSGHEPLSMLMPPSFLKSGVKIPWGIDIFPEWLSTAYFQDDVPVGPVALQSARGNIILNAEQAEGTFQPAKADGQGVAFGANSGQFLKMPMHRNARWNYRWGIFTFRIDEASGADGQTVLVDINKGETSSLSSPKIWYDKEQGLSIQFVGTNKGGLDKRIMTARNVVADGEAWNVAVFGIRHGQMFAFLNGMPMASETKQPPRFSGDWPPIKLSEGAEDERSFSYIGDQGLGNMAWAYDSLIFGQSEPSEAMVRKMTGWAAHRLGFAESLPENHPYRTDRPVLDAEDFPSRYVHDDVEWTKWGRQTKDKTITRVNAGGPRVAPMGFERVFFDDFHTNRILPSTSGESDLWGGPGFNPAVGGAVPLAKPGAQPNAYIYDPAKKNLILSALPSADKKRWFGSAIYTVNDMGWGHTWKGPKIFRIRCMFPKTDQKDLSAVLWPAFWSYGTDHLFWRTGNRIENDYFEFDGEHGAYLNGLSTHFHYAYLNKNIHARNPGSFQRYKVYGAPLNKPENKIPGGLFIWDGKFHTWEYVFDTDWTYINVTIPGPDGRDRWVEVCRVPTTPTYLQRVDLQMSYAFHQKKGKSLPKDGKRQDFVIDWVEVLQKTSQINAAPVVPFTARPQLTGEVKAGGTITCTAEVGDVTDVRYYWFADGYPLTYGPDNTHVLTAGEVGKSIRCLVQAVGARDQPEAWSNVLR